MKVLVILLTLSIVYNTSQALTKTELRNQCGNNYCVVTPTICNQGGETLWNQNYVLLVPYYLGIKDPGNVYIYYKDKLQSLTYHGQLNNKTDGDYIYGISTKWAYFHPGWNNANNWEVYFQTNFPPK